MASSTIEVLIRVKTAANKVVDNLNQSFKNTGVSAKKLNSTSTSKLEANVKNVDKSVKSVDTNAKKANKSLKDIAKAKLSSLNAQITKVKTNLTDAVKKSKVFSKSLASIKTQGKGLLPSGLLSGVFTGAIIKSAGDFSVKIAEVSTLVDSAITPTNELRQSVLDLSNEFGTDRTQVASGLYQAISAGAEQGAEANNLLKVALVAAKGGVTDAETAVDGLTTIINAFGLDMSEASDVSDVLFATMKNGKTTIEELSSQFFQAAPLAAALGIDFKEVSSALIGLTKQGTPTAQAMTQIRAALQGIAASKDSQKIFKDLGFESAQAAIKAKGLGFAFDAVRTATGGSIPAMQKAIGSIEGVQAVLQLSGDKAKFFNEGMLAVSNSTGAAQEAADKVQEALGARLNTAFTKLGNLAISAGTAIGNLLIPALEAVAEAAVGLSNLIEVFPEVAGGIGTLVASLILLKSALGAINLLKGVGTTLGLIAPAAGAAGTSLITLSGLFGALRTAIQAFFVGTGFAGFIALGAAIAFTVTQVTKVIGAIDDWTKAEAQLTKVKEGQLKIIKEAEGKGARSVEIKSAEELIALTQSQTDTYQEQLITKLKLVGAEVALFEAEGQAEKLIEAKKNQQAELLEAVQLSVDAEKRFADAANSSKGSIDGQVNAIDAVRVVLERTVQDANALGDAQRSIANLRYDQNIQQLQRVRDSQLRVLEIKNDLPALSEAYKSHFGIVSFLAEERAKELINIATKESSQIESIQVAAAETAKDKARVRLQSERDLSQQITQIRQQEINTVSQLRQDAFNKLQSLNQQSISIGQEIANAELSGENRIRELRRQGLSDFQSFNDKKKEIAELTSKFNKALADGDFATAKQLATRQISLSGQLVGEIKEGEKVILSREASVQSALGQTESAQQRLVSALKAQKDEVDAAKKAQQELLSSLDTTLQKLTTVLQQGLGEKLKVESEFIAPTGQDIKSKIDTAFSGANTPSISLSSDLNEESITATLGELTTKFSDADITTLITAQFSTEDINTRLAEAEQSLLDKGINVSIIPNKEKLDLLRAELLETAIQQNVEFNFSTEAILSIVEQLRAPIHVPLTITSNKDQVLQDIQSLNGTETRGTHTIDVVQNRAVGGLIGSIIPGFAKGTPRAINGKVSGEGTSTSDSILAKLSNGEFVIRAAAVRRYGQGLFQGLNSMRMPTGNLPSFASGGSTSTISSASTLSVIPTGSQLAPFNIVLPSGQSLGPFTGERDTTDILKQSLTRESLKFGGVR